jgi:hypothetical protein
MVPHKTKMTHQRHVDIGLIKIKFSKSQGWSYANWQGQLVSTQQTQNILAKNMYNNIMVWFATHQTSVLPKISGRDGLLEFPFSR